MSREVIWTLQEDEIKFIQKLFEKKTALENLARILDPSNEEMYKKVIEDYGYTSFQFNEWWAEMSEKYKWKSADNFKWSIDFSNGNIFLERI